MKRVIIGMLMSAALFACMHRAASAMAEFCPAVLEYQRAGSGEALTNDADNGATQAPSAPLYAFELQALGARTITNATLAFDTTGGWFTVSVPATTLTVKERHYTGPSSTFVRRDYVSQMMYARFPDAVSIRHAWVYVAMASGDGAFGWQAKGAVQCDPPPAPSPHQPAKRNFHAVYRLDPKDQDLAVMPSATSLVLAANTSKALENTDCAEPFRNATTKSQAQPRYPLAMRGFSGRATTTVEVAINSDGVLEDAWVWGPSGFSPFDDAALSAAQNTTYTGARAYCRPVPGSYFFRVTFE